MCVLLKPQWSNAGVLFWFFLPWPESCVRPIIRENTRSVSQRLTSGFFRWTDICGEMKLLLTGFAASAYSVQTRSWSHMLVSGLP